MRWQAINARARTITIPLAKNGHPRTVLLSPRAIQIFDDLPRHGELVFPIKPTAVRLAWEHLVQRAGLADLRFHDLRHEAVSRFFEAGLNCPGGSTCPGGFRRHPRCDAGEGARWHRPSCHGP
ncbi:tyrosine-type recombinase/integrase [Microvirga sp. G4-2]|uniref:tyrosine-type recombinase/integrase n=1 Tax=Microvirga sp. G4-2 TaxID=3434467 RepID=UPI004044FAA8